MGGIGVTVGVFGVSEPPLTPLRSSYGVFWGLRAPPHLINPHLWGILGSQSPPTPLIPPMEHFGVSERPPRPPLIPFCGVFRGHMGVFGVPVGVFGVSEHPPNAIDPHLWGVWGLRAPPHPNKILLWGIWGTYGGFGGLRAPPHPNKILLWGILGSLCPPTPFVPPPSLFGCPSAPLKLPEMTPDVLPVRPGGCGGAQ